MQTLSSMSISSRTSQQTAFEWDYLHGRKTRKWHDYLPEQYLLLAVHKKATVCVFSPGTNSERDTRSQPETPLPRWPCNELGLCGAGLPRGLWETSPPYRISSQGPHKAQNHPVSWSVLHLACQLAVSDPNCFLHNSWYSEVKSYGGPVGNLRHIRHFAGQGAFGANWVTHFWLQTPEVIKKAILWGHWISYQLFYSINSSWERLGWETQSPTASSRAAFWQHWRCWAGVHSI